MRSELVISTYNSPQALWLTLLSLLRQIQRPDMVCIADDGSGPETATMIQDFQQTHPYMPLRHIWQEDTGFEKNRILNKAVATSDAEFMLFIDGDCLLHPGYVRRHITQAHPSCFLTGSLIRLSQVCSDTITDAAVMDGIVFTSDWLRSNGVTAQFSSWLKSMPFGSTFGGILDGLSPIRKSWSGATSSTLRANILAVNGFDESLKYGGEDKEFGERLKNIGVRGRTLRYSTPVLHLEHPRSYLSEDIIAFNRAAIERARNTDHAWTEHGLVQNHKK